MVFESAGGPVKVTRVSLAPARSTVAPQGKHELVLTGLV